MGPGIRAHEIVISSSILDLRKYQSTIFVADGGLVLVSAHSTNLLHQVLYQPTAYGTIRP